MKIGFLYETENWCNQQIMKHLKELGHEVDAINLADQVFCYESLLKYDLFINRVFPSARLRGYKNTTVIGGILLKVIADNSIPIVNAYDTFNYDQSKFVQWTRLKQAGCVVPDLYCLMDMSREISEWCKEYPVILKPDQGGRSVGAHIANNEEEMKAALLEIEDVPYVVQKYVNPESGYTIRVEIIGDEVIAVSKRSIGEGGISSHHRGSRYTLYKEYPEEIAESSKQALRILGIELGSTDVIENKGKYYIIDVNSTSNFSEDKCELMGFDPTLKMTKYIHEKYCMTSK